ncbi:MAG: hypothetical protein JWR05_2793 [Mucilaginibacter sp.]|nr:hypothetical protein [Mucilaginibacter sp.]
MKKIKITYWITTAIVSLMMTYSAYAYVTQDAVQKGFQHLGFPSYFRVELAIAKLIGVVLLLAPVSSRIKEWAYAGFTITFISACAAHIAAGDPVSSPIAAGIMLILLMVSYFSYHKLQQPVQA